MRARESIWTTWLVLSSGLGSASSQTPIEGEHDPVRAARRLAESRGGGATVAATALADFESQDVAERRLRARILSTEATAEHAARVLALVADPDAVVRADLAHVLGRPEWTGTLVPERKSALARLAADDVDARVRDAARAGLVTLLADPEIARLADGAPTAERGELLAGLAGFPAGRASALDRASAPGDDGNWMLAARIAAETAEGIAVEHFLALVDDGLRRGSTTARAALERHARRLVQLGLDARALTVLAARPGSEAQDLRARLALARGRDPAAALAASRALAAAGPTAESAHAAGIRASRAARFAVCARLASGEEPDDAGLQTVRAALHRELATRADRVGRTSALDHAEVLEELAQVELTEAVRRLARGDEPDPAAALSAASAFHRAALRAHVAATRAELRASDGLDRWLGADDSVIELVLDAEPSTALNVDRRIAIRLALGRALATVAPDECIGFEPLPTATDDAWTAERREITREIVRAELAAAEERHARAAFAVERARAERPGGVPAELSQAELEARLTLQEAWQDVAALAQGDDEPLRDARSASWFGVTTARALREAGRGPEARIVLGRARAAIETSGAAQRWLWGIELLCEIEAATGASFTDDEEPAQAEVELLRAVERLQALEDLLRERGAPGRALDAVRNQRANALVSLAVNANVRMGKPDRALEHFEAAWKLRQDEFVRVLLACYRARSGRADEARAALATVVPGPGTYYNLACAWALLGERATAFDYLALELTENHAPGGSLERQKAWARKDPDLASLRDDPRFVELVGR